LETGSLVEIGKPEELAGRDDSYYLRMQRWQPFRLPYSPERADFQGTLPRPSPLNPL
jgi:hypothetical protein